MKFHTDGSVTTQDFKGAEGGRPRTSLKPEERFEKSTDKMPDATAYNEAYNRKKLPECSYVEWMNKHLAKKALATVWYELILALQDKKIRKKDSKYFNLTMNIRVLNFTTAKLNQPRQFQGLSSSYPGRKWRDQGNETETKLFYQKNSHKSRQTKFIKMTKNGYIEENVIATKD